MDCPVLSSLGKQTWTPASSTLLQPAQDTLAMNVSSVWRRRLKFSAGKVLDFAWVVVIYLASELLIWGLSRTLSTAHLQFFASIFGMMLMFILMVIACWIFDNCDDLYRRYVRDKVDFINSHLGLGFPIPLVMLNQGDILGGRQIARIIGNFVLTNLVSWTTIFALALLIMAIAVKSRPPLPKPSTTIIDPQPSLITLPQIPISWLSESVQTCVDSDREQSIRCPTPDPEAHKPEAASHKASFDHNPSSFVDTSFWWQFVVNQFPVLASFFGIFLLGAPIAAATAEERVLDGFVLWFIWVFSLRVQQLFKDSGWLPSAPKVQEAIATLMNPVLATTLLMTAYTRAKSAASQIRTLAQILAIFSSGTPLYSLWTAAATNTSLPENMSNWFGAGDAALSILECGILIWGFKLYECRSQLFSIAGLLTVLISIAAAAGNVFLSVVSGRTMGMGMAESLAFAARSTTLALAKPAMVAIGGNLGANAALVVSNGILGQLLYPFCLHRLRVGQEEENDDRHSPIPGSENMSGVTLNGSESSSESKTGSRKSKVTREILPGGDDPVTIAAGITIGINGAAMGVAYLYNTKSRAAPYAALAMTVFGIMTVVFTTVEPFRGVVIDLSS